MAIKIISEEDDYSLAGGEIKFSDIKKLANNHHKLLKKKKKQGDPNSSDLGPNDTKSVWFNQDQVNELFSENNTGAGEYGLRIYFGMYDIDAPIEMPKNPQLDKKETVILVVTKLEGNIHTDQINKGKFVNYGGMGMNHGELCPPPPGDPNCCNGASIQ